MPTTMSTGQCMSAISLLELKLAAHVWQTSNNLASGCTAQAESAGPLQRRSPCPAQACTLSMLLL